MKQNIAKTLSHGLVISMMNVIAIRMLMEPFMLIAHGKKTIALYM